MDHQAFAQLLGNYGEFVGAVAVIATLLYLASQVRSAQATVRASVRQAKAEQAIAIHQSLFTSDRLPEILADVTSETPSDLSPGDKERYRYYLHAQHRHFESYFMLFLDGIVDKETINAQSNVFSRRVFNNAQGREIWEWCKLTLNPQYVAWVEDSYAAADTTARPHRE